MNINFVKLITKYSKFDISNIKLASKKYSYINPYEAWLKDLGIENKKNIFWNLSSTELVDHAIKYENTQFSITGALICDTGKFKGRSPKDRYIVKESETSHNIWWGDYNQSITEEVFDSLYQRMIAKANIQDRVYIRDNFVCTYPKYQYNVRILNTYAWHNLFCHHLFIRPTKEQLKCFSPQITVLHLPNFEAKPSQDQIRRRNFTIINIAKKTILIGGTAYAGEIKKSIFTLLNYILPIQHNVLPMHCAANIDKRDPDSVALFFGLSGTGKTTLSASDKRNLIGDDEHGWSDENIFNFEGGCYAKVYGLTKLDEPEIYEAIHFGTILENTTLDQDTKKVKYDDPNNTENTRAAYPLHYLKNVHELDMGGMPKNIFFLTCDAHGLLPAISLLQKEQILFYFLLGYTAKVGGTEEGIIVPKTTFSPCFGAPFFPLHPIYYARMLQEKIEQHQVHVWMVNTGWVGGPVKEGFRIPLKYTRRMIKTALHDGFQDITFIKTDIFNLYIPVTSPGVPQNLLHPKDSWQDPEKYMIKAHGLYKAMEKEYSQYIES